MPDEATDSQKPGRIKWVILSSVLLIVLGGGGGAALYFTGYFSSSAEAARANGESAPSPNRVNEVLPLDPLVVNLADEGSIHYARVGVSLGVYNPPPGKTLLDENLLVPKLKDELLPGLGKRTSSELVSPEVRELLRGEIQALVNDILRDSEAEVQEVYFTEFIVQ